MELFETSTELATSSDKTGIEEFLKPCRVVLKRLSVNQMTGDNSLPEKRNKSSPIRPASDEYGSRKINPVYPAMPFGTENKSISDDEIDRWSDYTDLHNDPSYTDSSSSSWSGTSESESEYDSSSDEYSNHRKSFKKSKLTNKTQKEDSSSSISDNTTMQHTPDYLFNHSDSSSRCDAMCQTDFDVLFPVLNQKCSLVIAGMRIKVSGDCVNDNDNFYQDSIYNLQTEDCVIKLDTEMDSKPISIGNTYTLLARKCKILKDGDNCEELPLTNNNILINSGKSELILEAGESNSNMSTGSEVANSSQWNRQDTNEEMLSPRVSNIYSLHNNQTSVFDEVKQEVSDSEDSVSITSQRWKRGKPDCRSLVSSSRSRSSSESSADSESTIVTGSIISHPSESVAELFDDDLPTLVTPKRITDYVHRHEQRQSHTDQQSKSTSIITSTIHNDTNSNGYVNIDNNKNSNVINDNSNISNSNVVNVSSNKSISNRSCVTDDGNTYSDNSHVINPSVDSKINDNSNSSSCIGVYKVSTKISERNDSVNKTVECSNNINNNCSNDNFSKNSSITNTYINESSIDTNINIRNSTNVTKADVSKNRSIKNCKVMEDIVTETNHSQDQSVTICNSNVAGDNIETNDNVSSVTSNNIITATKANVIKTARTTNTNISVNNDDTESNRTKNRNSSNPTVCENDNVTKVNVSKNINAIKTNGNKIVHVINANDNISISSKCKGLNTNNKTVSCNITDPIKRVNAKDIAYTNNTTPFSSKTNNNCKTNNNNKTDITKRNNTNNATNTNRTTNIKNTTNSNNTTTTKKRTKVINTTNITNTTKIINKTSIGRANKETRKKYPCEICDKCFKTNHSWRRHMNIHAGIVYKCTFCDKVFKRPDTLHYHSLTHTSEPTIFCPICKKGFYYNQQLEHHLISHGSRKYSCETCGRAFKTKGNLSMHSATHNKDEEKRHECDICHRKFTRNYSLKLHKYIHTDTKPLNCESCDRSFSTSSQLSTHNLKIHKTDEGRRFTCPTCEKKFIFKHDLKKHMKIHSSERMFSCSTCNKRFIHRHHLKMHLVTHTDLDRRKDFSCLICDKMFPTVSSRNRHLNVHERDRFKCDECGECFQSSMKFKLHVINHKRIEYPCEECDDTFLSCEERDEHRVTHSDLERFSFDRCKKKRRTSEKRDYNSKHNKSQMKSYSCDDKKATLHNSSKCTEESVTKRYFLCIQCDKMFQTRAERDEHNLTHSDADGFASDNSDKTIKIREPSEKHNVTHSTVERCPRDKFNKTKQTPDTRDRHNVTDMDEERCISDSHSETLQEHTKRNEPNVDKECSSSDSGNETFQTSKERGTHNITQTEVELFCCEKCTDKFETQRDLDLHMMIHDNEVKIPKILAECRFCGKSFASKFAVKRHEMKHLQEYAETLYPTFQCSICEVEFENENSLKKHQRKNLQCRFHLKSEALMKKMESKKKRKKS